MLPVAFRVNSLLQYGLRAQSHLYVHAPFAFDFVTNVLYDRKPHPAYASIKSFRQSLFEDATSLTLVQPDGKVARTTVGAGAKRWSVSMRYGKLLCRMAMRLNPRVVLETGTGLGFSAACLALGSPDATVHSVDRFVELTVNARKRLQQRGIQNTILHTANIQTDLSRVASGIAPLDFVYLDAAHNYKSTVKAFHDLLPHLSNRACIMLDDIRWSVDMFKAWQILRTHSLVTLSLDIRRMGLLFLDPDLNREALTIYF